MNFINVKEKQTDMQSKAAEGGSIMIDQDVNDPKAGSDCSAKNDPI